MLERRLDLRAVEPDRAVDAPVADEDTSWLAANRLAFGNFMFVKPGPPSRRKIGVPGCCRARTDPRHGERDQPRLRVCPVLGDDERSAVGRVAALSVA